MSRSLIRPTWYDKSKVFCERRVVLTLGATKPKMFVDSWSGLCDFYSGVDVAALAERKSDAFVGRYGSLFLFFAIS